MYPSSPNPYAPPQNYQAPYGYGQPPYGFGDAAWDQPLATRGARFAARLLDGLMVVATMIPGIIWLATLSSESGASDPYGTSTYSTGPTFDDMLGPIFLMLLPALALTIYNWVLIAKRGQTIAKKWLNIKIVRLDGSPVDFVSGVILREWVQGFINNIPWIGSILGLIDACMIFSQDQQCMHDKIAKTKVIAVLPGGDGTY